MTLTWLVVIIVLAVAVLVLLNLVAKPTAPGIDKEHFKNEWQDILELTKHPKTRPLSIVHADKLLDEALKQLNFKGQTMAERLVGAKNKLTKKEPVWFAHKLRNKIVHESAFEPSSSDVKKSIDAYYRALKDLGVW